MKTPNSIIAIPTLLLSASTILSSYFILFVAYCVPWFFRITFRLSDQGLWDFIPAITRLATNYSWMFALIQVLILTGGIVRLLHRPTDSVGTMIVCLCGQGLVVWSAMFCFCFDGFLGTFCLHHDASFELIQFLTFGFAIFPVTLACLLFPISAVLLTKN